MILVFLIILIAIIFITLLFQFALKIKLVFNSENSDLNMTLLWLPPFVKAFVTMENARPVIELYLFNKAVFKRKLGKGKDKNRGLELVQLSNPKDVHVNVSYGFGDPFTTGIACGAINIASQFINIDSINQAPDFMASNDYIYLDATARVNVGSTLIRFFKSKNRS